MMSTPSLFYSKFKQKIDKSESWWSVNHKTKGQPTKMAALYLNKIIFFYWPKLTKVRL